MQGKTKSVRGAAAKGGAAKAKSPRKKAATKPRKAAAAVVDDTDDEGEADNAQHDDEVASELVSFGFVLDLLRHAGCTGCLPMLRYGCSQRPVAVLEPIGLRSS